MTALAKRVRRLEQRYPNMTLAELGQFIDIVVEVVRDTVTDPDVVRRVIVGLYAIEAQMRDGSLWTSPH